MQHVNEINRFVIDLLTEGLPLLLHFYLRQCQQSEKYFADRRIDFPPIVGTDIVKNLKMTFNIGSLLKIRGSR